MTSRALCFVALPIVALAAACSSGGETQSSTTSSSSSSSSSSASSSSSSSSGSGGAGGTAGTGGSGGAAEACAAVTKASACGDPASWVRGVASFDPAHFKPGAKPVLRVALRHGFVLFPGEENIGGRLHAYVNVPVADPASGKQAFAIDMCMFGTAMWSEENGTFHLVAMLDEDGSNNLDNATSNAQAVTIATPDSGELVKMADVEVSCHAPSPCVELTLDCTTGPACATITPITSCQVKTPSCDSGDAYCK